MLRKPFRNFGAVRRNAADRSGIIGTGILVAAFVFLFGTVPSEYFWTFLIIPGAVIMSLITVPFAISDVSFVVGSMAIGLISWIAMFAVLATIWVGQHK